jgi:GntR family transcriptional regulator/MocR family aminotransferase
MRDLHAPGRLAAMHAWNGRGVDSGSALVQARQGCASRIGCGVVRSMADSRSLGRASPDLLVRLDPRSREPLQRQIYGAIRQSIRDGILTPGSRVPSSRALALDLGVSRTTTQMAYEQLHADGYLEGRRRSGTFVAREVPGASPLTPPLHLPSPAAHPPLSRRGRALLEIPPAARRAGGPPRAFRIGVPALDLFPARTWSRLLAHCAARLTAAQLDYGDAAGWPALRKAIAGHVQAARGTRCTPDQVVIVGGAQRGIELVCHLLLDPGDDAWMEEPGYPGARSALAAAGARAVGVPVDEEGLDVETGAAAAPGARLVYVTPSHQFPLGVPMSLARRLALLQWATRTGAWIVEDDYDTEFRYAAHPLPCLHGLDPDGRVVYVGTFSKSLFPALRIGFLLVPPDVRTPILHARRLGEHAPPILGQMVLADFMTHGHYERHLRRMRMAHRERLEALADAIERDGRGALRLRPVRAGLHAVADLADAPAGQVAGEAMQRGVETMPLCAYAAAGTAVPDALVLGFGAVPPEAITQGVRTLVEAIEHVRRRRGARGRGVRCRAPR